MININRSVFIAHFLFSFKLLSLGTIGKWLTRIWWKNNLQSYWRSWNTFVHIDEQGLRAYRLAHFELFWFLRFCGFHVNWAVKRSHLPPNSSNSSNSEGNGGVGGLNERKKMGNYRDLTICARFSGVFQSSGGLEVFGWFTVGGRRWGWVGGGCLLGYMF